MQKFKSQSLNRWHEKGDLTKLNCRLGAFNVFFIDENKGKEDTILLIHGFPTSSYDFAKIWPSFSSTHRLITMDMLGFGFSEKPDNRQYSIHQQADLYESLIDTLGIDRYHVVAHDYGVSVAQELLARQLEREAQTQWLSCSLLNGGLFPETHRALLIQKLMLSPAGKWINRATGFNAFSRSFSSVFGPQTKPTKDELAEFWESICYNNGRHLFHNLITYILDRREHRQRWVSALQQSSAPLALINGSYDPVSGAHLVTRYKELKCRLDYLVELDNIGHYPQVEASQEVSSSILAFINSRNP